ncbi:MAG: hypothetical protein HY908_21740 [Myxococcales bacterium]|nr:hypothetical protein [Myxococcales bacterium]
MTTAEPVAPWRCLGGATPPASLGADLATVRALGAEAELALWELLEPHLGPRVAADASERATRFCATHGLRRDDTLPLVRGCRFLFRQAARADASVELVREDLAAALGDAARAGRLAELYGRALPAIRALDILDSLGRFGPVLRGAALRLDRVAVSRHLPEAVVPVALLTLEYADGPREAELTLQLGPAALAELRRVLAGA